MPRVKEQGKKSTDAADVDPDELVSYELGYLLMPTIAEEDVVGVVTSIKDALEQGGGRGFVDGLPTKKSLAYKMRRETGGGRVRVNQGYFGWVKFQCPSQNPEVLARALQRDERIVRFLFVHAPREIVALPPKRLRSSLLLRRPLATHVTPSATPDPDGTTVSSHRPTMTDEELDRTIEELIVD